MKTRKQYMNNECTHSEYYSQFVTDAVKRGVLNVIGKKRLMDSKDEHLNDIPLKVWDSLWAPWGSTSLFKLLGDIPSAAGYVCIYKEAARQIILADFI